MALWDGLWGGRGGEKSPPKTRRSSHGSGPGRGETRVPASAVCRTLQRVRASPHTPAALAGSYLPQSEGWK